MHLFEAYIALEEAMPGRGHLQRAAGLFAIFQRYLFDARRSVVREHFARNWSRHPDPLLADLVEPGHLFEWAWLLDRFGGLADRRVEGVVEALIRKARTGVTDEGLVLDALPTDLIASARPTHRLWPHTEAIKAIGLQHRSGVQSARAFADLIAGTLGRYFLTATFNGGWTDRVDAEGAPLSQTVPASSLYHLVLAATDAAAVFEIGRVDPYCAVL
jgi:mannose-6-phosphate isomerase